jgi:hypothetical protein
VFGLKRLDFGGRNGGRIGCLVFHVIFRSRQFVRWRLVCLT